MTSRLGTGKPQTFFYIALTDTWVIAERYFFEKIVKKLNFLFDVSRSVYNPTIDFFKILSPGIVESKYLFSRILYSLKLLSL